NLKHIGNYIHTQLKSNSFEEIQKLSEKEKKWINDFVPLDFEMIKDSDKEDGDDIAMDFESLATKYLIIDWKTHILTENMMYYQIIRADRSSKNYKIFSEIYTGWYKKGMGQPAQKDMTFHVLLMDNGIAIHMMIEKKYPFTQEVLSRNLNRRVEVDHESEMAFEILRFT
ncbi:hypothetical protein Tco_0855498, partial [Tanacetum coccineum]